MISSAEAAKLTIFAASSLTDAFTELGQIFKAQTGHAINFQFAGSQALSTQLLHGANADLYASADQIQYQNVKREKLIGTGESFVYNSLAIIVPQSSQKIKKLKDLSKPKLKIVIANPNVPAGQYTNQLLQKIEKKQPGFTKQFLSNVVSQESNIRQVALKVKLGEADAAIVYQSDFTSQSKKTIRLINIPKQYNYKAIYLIGILKKSKNKKQAKAFIRFIQSSKGQDILKKWGFQSILKNSNK